MYAKLFSSIYQGTLRGDSHGLLVFINLLAHADAHGWADIHPRAIAEETGLTLAEVEAAIRVLESPDPESRSPEEEGRRLIRLDEHRVWGWRLVNYGKYRAIKSEDDRREQNRIAQEKWRNRHKQSVSNRKQSSAESAQEEAEAEAEAEEKKKIEAPKRGSRFALTLLPDSWDSFCREQRPDLDPAVMFAKFSDYWNGVPGARGRKVDWDATWRNFIRSERATPDWAKPKQTAEQVALGAIRLMEERDAQKRAA